MSKLMARKGRKNEIDFTGRSLPIPWPICFVQLDAGVSYLCCQCNLQHIPKSSIMQTA